MASNNYVEYGSKTFRGDFNQVNLPSRNVMIYRDNNSGPQCLYTLLTQYLKRLPSDNEKTSDIFYPKPLRPHPTKPWFANVPVGKNKVNIMVKRMCEAAGLPPRTNHSLRVTGATTLFSKNAPKKLVQEVTWHRGLEYNLSIWKAHGTKSESSTKVYDFQEPVQSIDWKPAKFAVFF